MNTWEMDDPDEYTFSLWADDAHLIEVINYMKRHEETHNYISEIKPQYSVKCLPMWWCAI